MFEIASLCVVNLRENHACSRPLCLIRQIAGSLLKKSTERFNREILRSGECDESSTASSEVQPRNQFIIRQGARMDRAVNAHTVEAGPGDRVSGYVCSEIGNRML